MIQMNESQDNSWKILLIVFPSPQYNYTYIKGIKYFLYDIIHYFLKLSIKIVSI